jgi:hypothetical protein
VHTKIYNIVLCSTLSLYMAKRTKTPNEKKKPIQTKDNTENFRFSFKRFVSHSLLLLLSTFSLIFHKTMRKAMVPQVGSSLTLSLSLYKLGKCSHCVCETIAQKCTVILLSFQSKQKPPKYQKIYYCFMFYHSALSSFENDSVLYIHRQ